jgi:hypothetical protein
MEQFFGFRNFRQFERSRKEIRLPYDLLNALEASPLYVPLAEPTRLWIGAQARRTALVRSGNSNGTFLFWFCVVCDCQQHPFDPVLGRPFDGEAAALEDCYHSTVVRQHVGKKLAHALGSSNYRKVSQQQSPEALSLVFLEHGKSDLGAML